VRDDRDERADDVPADEDAPHTLPIEDWIDLHAFRPRDVPGVVRDYLDAAIAAGIQEVRIVHGRGIGVQRERVRALLAAHACVESFADAPPGRGHWGATIVRLRGTASASGEREPDPRR
jgi:dsDNA-specific endonuclease/ATPase MutS2